MAENKEARRRRESISLKIGMGLKKRLSEAKEKKEKQKLNESIRKKIGESLRNKFGFIKQK